MRSARPATTTYVAYLLLLVSFALLGLFVAALALGSGLAAWAGAGMLTALAASVAGFRAGAKQLARASAEAGMTHKVSFWADPLRDDEVRRYQRIYRSTRGGTARQPRTVHVGIRPESSDASERSLAA